MADWIWTPQLQRYRDLQTGRFLARSRVLDFVSDSIRASDSSVSGLARMLASDQLDLGGWQTLMRQEIKDEYVRQYVLGRGGLSQMTQADWGSIGGQLKEQFSYLDKFAQEISAGNLSESFGDIF